MPEHEVMLSRNDLNQLDSNEDIVNEERFICNVAYELARFGIKPTTESLEDFVETHRHLLEV